MQTTILFPIGVIASQLIIVLHKHRKFYPALFKYTEYEAIRLRNAVTLVSEMILVEEFIRVPDYANIPSAEVRERYNSLSSVLKTDSWRFTENKPNWSECLLLLQALIAGQIITDAALDKLFNFFQALSQACLSQTQN